MACNHCRPVYESPGPPLSADQIPPPPAGPALGRRAEDFDQKGRPEDTTKRGG